MHCTLDTVFQQDPFTAIDVRDGLALFMTEVPWAWSSGTRGLGSPVGR